MLVRRRVQVGGEFLLNRINYWGGATDMKSESSGVSFKGFLWALVECVSMNRSVGNES